MISAVTRPWNDVGAGGPSNGATRSPVPGRARSSAATAWRQNRAGSLSPASSDSHATGCPPRRAQSASRTVLPYPAGAAARMSPRARPSSSRAVSRGRSTWPGRDAGMCSLVASSASRSGAATDDSTITDLHAGASAILRIAAGKEPSRAGLRFPGERLSHSIALAGLPSSSFL